MKIKLKEPRVPGEARAKLRHRFEFTKNEKIGLAIFLALSLSISSYFLFFNNKEQASVPVSAPTIKPAEVKEKIYSPLTGSEVTKEQANRPITAIIIENHTEARPQSGLKNAGIVFEAIAEGGITRFAAIYQEATPQDIGPVRSLRPYFLDWLRPFDATIVHVGGSQKSLRMVRDGSWKDMDQFANGKSFRRITEKRAPHNVYTSFENIDKFNQNKEYRLGEFQAFERKDEQKSSASSAPEIKLNVSSGNYNASFSYNPNNNSYLRSQGGKPHLDKSGAQIEPKVVIALVSPHNIVQEDGSRYSYKTIGTGTAVIFQDGNAQEVTWQKKDQASQLKFIDASGAEVKLNRGQTWITAIGDASKLSYN
jgi:hypothetical protein